MKDLIPTYLAPDVLLGSVVVVAAMVFGLHGALRLTGLPIRERRSAFWLGSAMLMVWFFASLALSWSGFYAGTFSRVPTVPFGLLLPMAAGVTLFRRVPALRRIIESVPMSWITSVQVFRVEGLVFLTLLAGGWLPGVFAWPAGVGDVIVGLFAPVVGIAFARGARGSSGWLRVWNLLGIVDLVVALTTGFLSSPSPLQMLAFDRPNELISAFPLVMIPVFLVPLAFLLHLASLHKLRQIEAEKRNTNQVRSLVVREAD
jgi:hypothetical protein